ncbi:MAG: hypothetical protein D3910_19075 [Candidatus Electrothrix sp. ATG2]|nr:hypothetical protein [Candidatus Electrothrix sp. ATG2]
MQELIEKSKATIRWIDSKKDGLPIDSDGRTKLSAACFDLVLEHQKSVVLLIEKHLNGSAFALIRLIFDAYIRGLWLYHSASETEIEKYKNEKLKKPFGDLIKDVEKIDGYSSGILSQAKKAGWDAMNSYTHSGFLHLTRRVSEDSIEPIYTDEEKVEAIKFANSCSLMAVIGIASLAKNQELANDVLEHIKQNYPRP